MSIFAETSYPLLAAAVTCPTNSNGASVVSGCSPDAGYYGTVIATTIHPHYATDGANGVSVASCTSQDAASCTTDATATCATKAGQTTTMACDDPAEGFWVDQGFATVRVARRGSNHATPAEPSYSAIHRRPRPINVLDPRPRPYLAAPWPTTTPPAFVLQGLLSAGPLRVQHRRPRVRREGRPNDHSLLRSAGNWPLERRWYRHRVHDPDRLRTRHLASRLHHWSRRDSAPVRDAGRGLRDRC